MAQEVIIPPRTVMNEIKAVLPVGSIDPIHLEVLNKHSGFAENPVGKWDLAPFFPPDVFAVTGQLCQLGGVMGYFDPNPNEAQTGDNLVLSKGEKKCLKVAGKAWRKTGLATPSTLVQELWSELLCHGSAPLRQENGESCIWWPAAIKLLIIADVASKGLGRYTAKSPAKNRNPFNVHLSALFYEEPEGEITDDAIETATHVGKRKPASICLLADMDYVCVYPKGRVAQVGCTLRNLSANLALLPPRGMVRCHWMQPQTAPTKDDHSALDILLIPLPFNLTGRDFKACDWSVKSRWGNFEIEQPWLNKKGAIIKMVKGLLKKAQTEAKTVNGIIFPEYALTYEIFEDLCTVLQKIEPGLEFIVAGSSTNCDATDETANYVLTAINYDVGEPASGGARYAVTSRKKHHRWCLNSSQVSDYALSSSLNPGVKKWWEKHHISKRELYFHQFRRSSVFATMICEDLARNDPCHEILRSIGPNLLFALLMDGPQIQNRWSSRYASSLADDPGSSVLTFTSFGLVDRMNSTNKHPENRSVALWKDETGQVVEILMPKEGKDCGILISLSSCVVKDLTIDGREIENCSWKFEAQLPVVLGKS